MGGEGGFWVGPSGQRCMGVVPHRPPEQQHIHWGCEVVLCRKVPRYNVVILAGRRRLEVVRLRARGMQMHAIWVGWRQARLVA